MWRCDLVLDDLDTHTVADDLAALFERLDTAYIHTDGRVKLQCTATGCNLRIAEHDTDFFTQLVDKDHGTAGFADDTGQFTKCLRHQSCMQTYVRISHIALDLCFWHQCCHRVHDDNVHCSGTHHGLCDLQSLLTVIRL